MRIPNDRQRLDRALGAPPRVGHHRNRIGQSHHLMHTLHGSDRAFIDRLRRAAKSRAMDNGRVEHPRQPHVDCIDRLRRDLVEHVKTPARLADQLPGTRVFQRDVHRRRELRRIFGNGTERQRATAWPVRDYAHSRHAFRCRNFPAIRCGGNEHFARRGACLPQKKLRRRDRPAGAGHHVAPDAVPAHILFGMDEFSPDSGPVAFEFLGDQHGKAGMHPLPHLGARNPDNDRVVRMDDQPGGDFAGLFGSIARARTAGRWRAPALRPQRLPWQ